MRTDIKRSRYVCIITTLWLLVLVASSRESCAGDTAEGTAKPPSAAALFWLLLENDVPLCMVELPEGWTVEGNFVQNPDSLSFPGLLWIRLSHAEKGLAVSLLKSVGSRAFKDTFFDSDPKDRWVPDTYVPFHGLQFMSAWQFLWFYVSPLAKAVYPDCETGEPEGDPVRQKWGVCLPEAALPFTYHARDGRRMEARVVLTLWNRGGCPSETTGKETEGPLPSRRKFWGIDQMVIVSKPVNESFSPNEARALLQRLRFSPDATAALALPPERIVATADQPSEGSLSERLNAARQTGTILRFRLSRSLSEPERYMPPPQGASRIPIFSAPVSLENALVEMLMSGRTLYPDYAVSEWKKVSRELDKNAGYVTHRGD